MIEEDAFAALAGKHRRERWRREWINRFRERQRTVRKWIEFVEIAKWCARSTTGASADAEQQALELGYQRLAASVLHGEFEVRGRSEIFYLDPTAMTDGMTSRWRLSRAQFDVVAKICESSLPMPALRKCGAVLFDAGLISIEGDKQRCRLDELIEEVAMS
jgi:hypothetical protein